MISPERLNELWNANAEALSAKVKNFALRDGTAFEFDKRAYLMGVINLSPDSWYRESVCHSIEHAVERGRVLHLQGASLVDVGAESTLPQAQRVGALDQRELLLPVVEQLTAAGVPVSVETYHAQVAAACLERGAAVVNLTGMAESAEIYRLAARHRAGVIICFVAGENVRQVGNLPEGQALADWQREHFERQIAAATAAGVERLWIDPGLGFYYGNLMDSAKRVAYQLETFVQTFRLRTLGWPVCHALPHAFTYFREEVRSAEGMFAVIARLGKTDLLRTHEIARVRPVIEALG
jgi:dihydropteroate synthase